VAIDCVFFASRFGTSQKKVEGFLPITDYGKGIKPRVQKYLGLERPKV
jgi:hypothetical protein